MVGIGLQIVRATLKSALALPGAPTLRSSRIEKHLTPIQELRKVAPIILYVQDDQSAAARIGGT
jgi:hypothetical protein